MFSGLSFALCYFIPTIVAWIRKRMGMPTLLTLRQIFFFNLLTGFTILGWFLMLANAFNRNPVAWVVARLANPLIKYGNTGALPPPAGGGAGPAGGTSRTSCGACGGSGSMMCSSCGGRGSWYNPPTTATGSAQLQTCPACTSSGRIRCMSCGGSGRVPGPIG
jgi:Superinfection immunity protein